MNIILIYFLVAIFIGIPVVVYSKTVEISSKYTFTRFLIAWPLRLGVNFLACGTLIVLSALPIILVTTIIGVVLSLLFNFNEKYVEYIVYGVLTLNAAWLIKEIVFATVKQFINDFTNVTKK